MIQQCAVLEEFGIILILANDVVSFASPGLLVLTLLPVGSMRIRPGIVCANVNGSQNLPSSSETEFKKRNILLQGGNDRWESSCHLLNEETGKER